MKKTGLILFFTLLVTFTYAQKYAFVDTEYILSNIPAYKAAQDKLNELSLQWQREIEAEYSVLDKMYKDFQSEKVLLTKEMIKQRELEIASKEKAIKDLQKKFWATRRIV